MSPSARALPRPFAYHWGSGQIVEEAAYTGEHHEPAIQLLQYDESAGHAGWSIRFCFYNPRDALAAYVQDQLGETYLGPCPPSDTGQLPQGLCSRSLYESDQLATYVL